jgi:HPt (histidine-containing phosphotransfer) domain-containing protein
VAAGMRDHVAKPVDLEQLVACLRRHVGEAPPVAPAAALAAAAAAIADMQPLAPLLERDAAMQRLGGRQALYERLATSFAGDAPRELAALRAHLTRRSVSDALRVLHTLRGLAGTVGASALATLAGREEQALRGSTELAGVDADGLDRLLEATLLALNRGAPAPRPASPAPEPGSALEALRRMRVLLVERNMRCVAACERLQAVHGAALGAEFSTLAAAVARLDFPRALKACDLLLDRLNPR